MKYFSIFALLMCFSTSSFAEDSDTSSGLSSKQKWVLGLTAGAVAGTFISSGQNDLDLVRKGVLAVGAASFIGVSIYESKQAEKKKKLELGLVEGNPALMLSARF